MENKDVYAELSSIRNIMERSTRFISLSGLSGVMAGLYALIGAGLAYKLLYADAETSLYRTDTYNHDLNFKLFIIALVVLVLSISTGIWLTIRKAQRKGQSIWNQSSRALLKSGLLPLLIGGCFVLILLYQGHYGIIAPGCLIFYGLALVAASQYTFGDVKWLGLSEIALGLLATFLPGYGLAFWTLGFGVLHILYGTIMHFKYDRENSSH
ncbi:hypothetical protein HH214_20655 [Mucilaginibacter robiniae]|uniref:Uncharacterized protein n=1 Tax=Mucilaginibacter robiniae TaxID=2728022 RepID=A0A7L5E470_9SPHI|nr:hypothetical protein [Mucilaginibacter robiniae]QJD98112.1 hypothetical protein HH214_20655 [Mucilaginibacter robiniae]